MKKILFLFIAAGLLFHPQAIAKGKLVRTINNLYNNSSIYDNDLSAVEEYMFGGNFRNETVQSRLDRIESNLFSQTYPALTLAQRMNNVLANYRKNNLNRNYLSDYYGRNVTPAQRVRNYFFGQPTGFTPPVMNMPFNDYGRPYGMNKSFYNSKGHSYYSNETPAGASLGVHILDD